MISTVRVLREGGAIIPRSPLSSGPPEAGRGILAHVWGSPDPCPEPTRPLGCRPVCLSSVSGERGLEPAVMSGAVILGYPQELGSGRGG